MAKKRRRKPATRRPSLRQQIARLESQLRQALRTQREALRAQRELRRQVQRLRKPKPKPKPKPRLPRIPPLPKHPVIVTPGARPPAYVQRVYRDRKGRFLSKAKAKARAKRQRRRPRRQRIERRPVPDPWRHLTFADGTRLTERDYEKLRSLLEWMQRRGYDPKSFRTVEQVKDEYAYPEREPRGGISDFRQRQAEQWAERQLRALRTGRRAS